MRLAPTHGGKKLNHKVAKPNHKRVGGGTPEVNWSLYPMIMLVVSVHARQCCGSIKFLYGSRSADPPLRLMDPNPAIFVSDLQDVNKEYFFAYYFLKIHLHHFSKIRIRIRISY